MIRKLRNSLNALLLTSALCATGAFAVAAMPFAAVSTPASAPGAVAAHADAGPRKAVRLSRIRHSLAMPYFSFVPRG